MADWSEPLQQPSGPGRGELAERVADADRDGTVTLLREHVVDGRLTLDEFSERVGLALEARTRGELQKAMANLPAPPAPQEEGVARRSRRWHVAIMSGSSTKGRWRMSGRTNALAIMGGCDMDLRRAEIDGPEVLITAVAFWGGVKIVVPEGFDVDLQGFSFMGGRSMRMRDVPRVPGSPRIVIRGFSIMGGIEVRSRPNQSGQPVIEAVAERVRSVVDALPSRAGTAPIDLAALSQEIRRQIHTQHHPRRHRHGNERPGGSRSDAAAVPPTEPMPNDGTVTILFSDMV
ncbi:MAG TPA: DUF1707 domain-containing protein, partial [Acidimicrobiales bacterium]|nr:DUF1707 domain-containing protein [Acidimicrobiales bacterium]